MLTVTHLDFALKIGKPYTWSYPRAEPVLVLDTVPKKEDINIQLVKNETSIFRTEYIINKKNVEINGDQQ